MKKRGHSKSIELNTLSVEEIYSPEKESKTMEELSHMIFQNYLKNLSAKKVVPKLHLILSKKGKIHHA